MQSIIANRPDACMAPIDQQKSFIIALHLSILISSLYVCTKSHYICKRPHSSLKPPLSVFFARKWSSRRSHSRQILLYAVTDTTYVAHDSPHMIPRQKKDFPPKKKILIPMRACTCRFQKDKLREISSSVRYLNASGH
jgi:hypothetical protein